MNTLRGGGAASGTTTDGLFFAGASPGGLQKLTEAWDGSSWTEVNDMTTARSAVSGEGTGSAASWVAGGYIPGSSPAISALTEEFTSADFQIKSVTTS